MKSNTEKRTCATCGWDAGDSCSCPVACHPDQEWLTDYRAWKPKAMPNLETPKEYSDRVADEYASGPLTMREVLLQNTLARDASLRAESDALLKTCGEALEETTRQLENMNQSPAHACSWVKPQSGSTTERIRKNKAALAALREAGVM